VISRKCFILVVPVDVVQVGGGRGAEDGLDPQKPLGNVWCTTAHKDMYVSADIN
jgi:hypothetical protein